MFMQAGFTLVEAGFTRAKNAGNIIMKNFMDFAVGGLVYWAFGFALAYGGTSLGGFLATGNWFFNNEELASTWFFQVVFAATAATIVSGAVAGRVKFSSYLIYTPFITGLIYPIVTHWVWSGQGWLTELGFVDFAGSGVVHMLGGVAALAGVLVIGPPSASTTRTASRRRSRATRSLSGRSGCSSSGSAGTGSTPGRRWFRSEPTSPVPWSRRPWLPAEAPWARCSWPGSSPGSRTSASR
jgi:ammonia channel protein AmtB